MNKLIICRGLPGSGKSYQARIVASDYQDRGWAVHILSTDDFFINENNEYKYDKALIGTAHAWNKARSREAISTAKDKTLVIIDNTNTRSWEFEFYIQVAQQHGFEISYLYPETPWAWNVDECFERNTHNCPRETIQRMKDNFEEE